MVLNNMGIAFSQHGQLHLSLKTHDDALQLLQKSDYPKAPVGQTVTEDHELGADLSRGGRVRDQLEEGPAQGM